MALAAVELDDGCVETVGAGRPVACRWVVVVPRPDAFGCGAGGENGVVGEAPADDLEGDGEAADHLLVVGRQVGDRGVVTAGVVHE